jgi:hypothetical protein
LMRFARVALSMRRPVRPLLRLMMLTEAARLEIDRI